LVLSSGNKPAQTSAVLPAPVVEGAPVLVVVASNATFDPTDTVPRLNLRPASVADGPVHGLFSTPVVRA
jgi:hypothetical protein